MTKTVFAARLLGALSLSLLSLCSWALPGPSGGGKSLIIIDHTCAKLEGIPRAWIEKAKKSLHIAYGFTSHGSQITEGMRGLMSWKGPLYGWSRGGAEGTLDFWNFAWNFGQLNIANDLGADINGNLDRKAWERATRAYLAKSPEINVIMWSWCWQVDGTKSDIELYLALMDKLEQDFPSVRFVYMTGHVDGKGLGGNVHKRNEQIRSFCRDNGKILYDFADIESYDPDGQYYGDKRVADSCDYDSDRNGTLDRNWAKDWQEAHPGEWYECEAAHTQPLNANLKAYAAWWLWARLAGWDGQ